MAVTEPGTGTGTSTEPAPTTGGPSGRRPHGVGGGDRRRRGGRDRRGLAGWLFVAPAVLLLVVFLVAPIFMALWVSLTDWRGRGSPFSGSVPFVGLDNYRELLAEEGLVRRDFMTSLRNNFYYVIIVVALQTALSLFLALVLAQKLRARSFFRTAFYFPAVTSSVAISLVFLFLFTGTGAVNAVLGFVGITGPNWFADPRGLIHLVGDWIGVWSIDAPPAALTDPRVLGLSLWEWSSGPSIAMLAIVLLVVWTTTGTFMLMFLAALQDFPREVEEAALIDGTNRWQRFRYVTLPILRPTLFLVLTLGLIGTWQVFDQIYIMSQGAPAKTTLTPAYLSYDYSFIQGKWGQGTAMAFALFAIIVILTSLQRYVMRDKDEWREKKQRRAARRQQRRVTRVAAAETGTSR